MNQPNAPHLPQLPGLDCLRCDVCCRFSSPAEDMPPGFSAGERDAILAAGMPQAAFSGAAPRLGEPALLAVDGKGSLCFAFDRSTNGCRFYPLRPFDCKLYPLTLMFDDAGANVMVAADPACPAVERMSGTAEMNAYVDAAARLLDNELLEEMALRRSAIGQHKPWMERITPLPNLTRRVCRTDLGLRHLTLAACKRLTEMAGPVKLAGQALAAIRPWTDCMELFYAVEGERVLLFGGGDGPAFLLTPPLGRGPLAPALARGQEVLRAMNPSHIAPRVQEVDDAAWAQMEKGGWTVTRTFEEFVYERQALADLSGHEYKGKRSARNFFEKTFAPTYRPFAAEDLPACMELCRRWSAERAAASREDDLFLAQLQASGSMVARALREAGELGLKARVVEAQGRIVACAAGFDVPGADQFAVMIEFASREHKGAAAWLYQQMCAEAAPAPWINAMSDSGLAGLARVKESYHPARRLTSRVVARGPRSV
ncbi:MAG TPA: phosphatidylglycerol lysyltransferase domain-containing protein [Candidatus Brocadiia bacterium]|nr:phosphatidylglycerol lysyltransferase domain-containing protein [Candidatus Brocadiia bacterium]